MYKLFYRFNGECLGEFNTERDALYFANGYLQGKGKTHHWIGYLDMERYMTLIKD